ncbi:MAG: AraC family transcriptional regulator [Myxococcota bacterium]
MMLPNENESDRVLRRVRELLTQEGTHLSLSDTAKRLAMADRTLQYKLAQAGTSFRIQIQEARIRSAKQLLRATDLKVSSIAYDVGFSSSPHFSTWFKHHVGTSPSEWRRDVGRQDAAQDTVAPEEPSEDDTSSPLERFVTKATPSFVPGVHIEAPKLSA